MAKVIKVLGPPGCGKTTYLLNLVGKALEKGIAPTDICFTTFSKAGVLEAKERARDRFNLNKEDLRNFTTIHAMCFRALNLSRDRVFGGKLMGIFARQLGLRLTWETEEGIFAHTKDDRIINILNYAEVTKKDIKAIWEEHKDIVPWFELVRAHEAMKQFKEKNKLISYNDMINRVAEDPTIELPKFKYLFVDEAQDSSTIQWNVIKNKLLGHAEVIYFAGDDDQAIFAWAGADVNEFIDFKVDETIILGQSYRCPKTVQGIANRVATRISKRLEKSWKPIEADGEVHVIQSIHDAPLDKGNWLLLGRNRSVLKDFEKDLRLKGFYYETKNNIATDKAWKPSMDYSLFELVRKYWYFQEYKMIQKNDLLQVIANTGLAHKINQYKKELPDIIQLKLAPPEIYQYFTEYPWAEGIVTHSIVAKGYIEAMIKRGEQLNEIPRLRLSTIHSIKGGESENVLLSLDLSDSSYRALQNSKFRDEELRVLYVGLTRASKKLYLLYPQTNMNYLTYLRK